VPQEEQVDVKTVVLEGTKEEQAKEAGGAGTAPALHMAASFVGLAGGGQSAISAAERQEMESEKMKLYQQLDDKVCQPPFFIFVPFSLLFFFSFFFFLICESSLSRETSTNSYYCSPIFCL
jgi:hypothetical protein